MSNPNSSSTMRMPWQPPPPQQQNQQQPRQSVQAQHYLQQPTATMAAQGMQPFSTSMTPGITMSTTYHQHQTPIPHHPPQQHIHPQQPTIMQQQPPQQVRSLQLNHRGRMERTYRGIYSSSICGMFETTKASKSDACALACCGVWLWERNQYISKRIKPKSWWERKMEFAGIGCLVVYVIVLNLVTTSAVEESDPVDFVLLSLLIAAAAAAIYVMCAFSRARTELRQEWAWYIFLEQHGPRPDPALNPDAAADYDQQWKVFLWKHKIEIQGGHAVCTCLRNDKILTVVEDGNNAATTMTTTIPTTSDDNHHEEEEDDQVKRDVCTVLWRLVANCCCGVCCNCWCQLCGMCAIAQEHRHLQQQRKLLVQQRRRRRNNNGETVEEDDEDEQLWQSDYITIQPWKEYIPEINRLRALQETSWSSHVGALSQLSMRLYRGVQCLLVMLFLLMMTTPWMSGWQFLVLLGTLFQPTFILYGVYWLWHRLDISLDAVLKFFASGFVICTSMAMVYELAVSTVTDMGLMIFEFFSAIFLAAAGQVEMDDDQQYNSATGTTQSVPHVAMPQSFLLISSILSAFVSSFIVASLVEEIAKYLSFWMLEHADLEDASPSTHTGSTTAAATRGGEGNVSDLLFQDETPEDEHIHGNASGENHSPSAASFAPVVVPRSFSSRGAAITIAMVTVALGFGCAENLLYVFVYTPPGLDMEIITLVMRCMFPVHPLCAALQSIGVCRRELEQRQLPTVQRDGLGRIMFPAWVLHGLFDFILMVVATYAQMESQLGDHSEKDDGSGGSGSGSGGKPEYHPADNDENAFAQLAGSIPSVCFSFMILIFGFAYYIKEAYAQRVRLNELDRLYLIHNPHPTSNNHRPHNGSESTFGAGAGEGEQFPMTFGYSS